jgi:hypothetical protein
MTTWPIMSKTPMDSGGMSGTNDAAIPPSKCEPVSPRRLVKDAERTSFQNHVATLRRAASAVVAVLCGRQERSGISVLRIQNGRVAEKLTRRAMCGFGFHQSNARSTAGCDASKSTVLSWSRCLGVRSLRASRCITRMESRATTARRILSSGITGIPVGNESQIFRIARLAHVTTSGTT